MGTEAAKAVVLIALAFVAGTQFSHIAGAIIFILSYGTFGIHRLGNLALVIQLVTGCIAFRVGYSCLPCRVIIGKTCGVAFRVGGFGDSVQVIVVKACG